MARTCEEIQVWIEEEVERPIEEFERREERRCREEPCNPFLLCANKLFCWIVVAVVKVVRWAVVIIGKWVSRTVCEVAENVLSFFGAIIAIVLSIPILGGILRLLLNIITEALWRSLGLFEFLVTLAGIRARKKMYFGVVVPFINGVAPVTDAEIMTQVNSVIDFFDRTCNISVRFTGICHSTLEAPGEALDVHCSEILILDIFSTRGSYFEFAAIRCKFDSNWRRIIGLGGEVIIYVIRSFTGDTTGCSSMINNYALVIPSSIRSQLVMAHEIGHTCGLWWHDADTNNLMNDSAPSLSSLNTAVLNNFQIATLRASRHCFYF